MIEPESWMTAAVSGLTDAFGGRLKYVGLQGSYRRGEATESSDIDVVTLLDAVGRDDLDRYRGIVHALPEGEKACGFICGTKEFYHWPRHELFPFKMDTRDYYGRLDEFLPPIAREDITENARIGASALYHMLAHSYLYAGAEALAEVLRGGYKSAFFVLQVTNYLKTGDYSNIKRDLAARLVGDEKTIAEISMDFSGRVPAGSEQRAFDLLFAWCGNILATV